MIVAREYGSPDLAAARRSAGGLRNRRRAGLPLLTLALFLTGFLPGSEAAADPEPRDRLVEQVLLEGEVVEIQEIKTGTTFPRKLTLRFDGEIQEAVFKFAHVERPDRAPRATPGSRLLDSYRHEVAAYRLDRALGMNMVPVAVIREIDGTVGAVMEWIPDALDERAQRGTIWPRDPRALARQQAVMDVFDALILNLARDGADELITVEDWKVHLIDHSRGFREQTDLPAAFLARCASLPRDLLKKLELLDRESLDALLEGLLGHDQIAAILTRRDRILEKIAADREECGDAAVFQD